MAEVEKEATQTFEQFNRDQLEIYARELNQHFREERALRQKLEERNKQLEQRVQEITALNALFRQNLEQRSQVEEGYHSILEKIKRLAEEVNALVEEAKDSDHRELGGVDLPDSEGGK